MPPRRILALGPDNEPAWAQLYVQPVGDRWAAMLAANGMQSAGAREMEGLAFFGDIPEEAERAARAHLGTESW